MQFWQDARCADETLCSFFLNVYNVARDKKALVGGVWKEEVDNGFWEIHFNKQAKAWAAESFVNFYDHLYKSRPVGSFG